MRDGTQAPDAAFQERLNTSITHVMIQVDRAVIRKDTHVRVRVSALVDLLQTIALSTQVAKEQRRQRGQGFWHSLVEMLRHQ